MKREIKIVVMQRDVSDYGQKATIITHLDIRDSRVFDAKKKLKKQATKSFFPCVVLMLEKLMEESSR